MNRQLTHPHDGFENAVAYARAKGLAIVVMRLPITRKMIMWYDPLLVSFQRMAYAANLHGRIQTKVIKTRIRQWQRAGEPI